LQGNPQKFFYAVVQDASRSGIDRQDSAFNIVDAEQVVAVLD
jgi:hypothetical protein